jgi:hypothetical protein
MASLRWAIPKVVNQSLSDIMFRRLESILEKEKSIKMDSSWIPYLHGITDASMDKPEIVDACTELIGAITNLGPITVWNVDGV